MTEKKRGEQGRWLYYKSRNRHADMPSHIESAKCKVWGELG